MNLENYLGCGSSGKVQSSAPAQSRPLSVYLHIQAGGKPCDFYRSGKMSRDQVKRAVKWLLTTVSIKKMGYGVYEILNPFPAGHEIDWAGAKTPPHTPPMPPHAPNLSRPPTSSGSEGYAPGAETLREIALRPPDTIRGHGYVFICRPPALGFQWSSKKEEIIKKAGLCYKTVPQGISVDFEHVRIILCAGRDNKLMIHTPYSWFGDTSAECIQSAMNSTERLVYRFGRALGVNFLHRDGRAWLRPAKYHYALIKNAFAEKFTKEGFELCLKDEYGGFLIFDRSNKTGELERMGHNAGQKIDKDKAFFNAYHNAENPASIFTAPKDIKEELKEMRGVFQGFAEAMKMNAESQLSYAKQIETHLAVMNGINESFKSFNELLHNSNEFKKITEKKNIMYENEPFLCPKCHRPNTIIRNETVKQKTLDGKIITENKKGLWHCSFCWEFFDRKYPTSKKHRMKI